MEQLSEVFPLLVLPFVACVVIASLHCYMGLHVIKRGVIFVDLALAQCAALGAAVALFIGPIVGAESHHHHGTSDAIIVGESQLAEQLELEDETAFQEPQIKGDAHGQVSHEEAHDDGRGALGYTMSLLFALLGAVLLSIGRLRDDASPTRRSSESSSWSRRR